MSHNMGFTRPAGGGASRQGYLEAATTGRLPFIQKVYALLTASILVAIGAGALVMHTPPAATGEIAGRTVVLPMGVAAVANMSFVIWIALLLMLFLGRRIAVMPGVNVIFLFAFTGICGAWATPSIWFYGVARGTPEVVGMAGSLTAVIFVALSVIAYTSRHDFNFLAAGLHLAWIGLVAGGLLNAFVFHSDWAFVFISWAVVLFAGACILVDTSFMLRRMDSDDVVPATISLFVDILNLFLALLRILGGGRR